MLINNDTHNLLSLLAYVHLEHNSPEKTITLLQALFVLGISTPQEKTMLSLALLQNGEAENALTQLEEQALHNPVDASFHLVRAQVLHALDRRNEASIAMQTYLHSRETTVRTRESRDPY